MTNYFIINRIIFEEDRLLPIDFKNPAQSNGALRRYLNNGQVDLAVQEPANISGVKRRKNNKAIDGNFNNIAYLFLI